MNRKELDQENMVHKVNELEWPFVWRCWQMNRRNLRNSSWLVLKQNIHTQGWHGRFWLAMLLPINFAFERYPQAMHCIVFILSFLFFPVTNNAAVLFADLHIWKITPTERWRSCGLFEAKIFTLLYFLQYLWSMSHKTVFCLRVAIQ